MSGKLLIPCCLCLLSSDGYLVDENCDRVVQAAGVLVWRVHCIFPGEDEIAQVVCVLNQGTTKSTGPLFTDTPSSLIDVFSGVPRQH